MTGFTSRTLQQKINGRWQVVNAITDQAKISAMLCDEMTIKYVFRQKTVKRIKYTGIGIVVTFDKKTKAVYAR